jgi:hypothetical protein
MACEVTENKANIIIPPVNTKGAFSFKEPFNLLASDQEYKVNGIRSLTDLYDSGEKPYENIYLPVGLTDVDFKNDLDQDIPIIVFTTGGNDYFYVPANRVLTMPIINGVKYQDKILAIHLGSLPLDMDLTIAKNNIIQAVYDNTGIESTVEVVPASATVFVTYQDDETFKKLISNNATVKESYRNKYMKEVENTNKLQNTVNVSTECMTLKLAEIDTLKARVLELEQQLEEAQT